VRGAGVFDPGAVDKLWQKCQAGTGRPLSNTDNMALVGVLSTQLLHELLVRRSPGAATPAIIKTAVEREEP
jgi:asparagine synthase (glutamine-hydrolysing)